MRILLTERGIEALNAPLPGHDELSELERRLHGHLMGNMLMVTTDDWERLHQFADGLAEGEERQRAAAIVEGARKG